MVDTDTIKSNVRRLFNVINSGDLESLDEFVDENITYKTTSGEEVHGLEEFKDYIAGFREAFSDAEFSIENLYLENNKGVNIYRQTGTMNTDFWGIEANDQKLDLLVCSIGTFNDDGQLTDIYEVVDTLDLLRQLDALPEEVKQMTSNIGASR